MSGGIAESWDMKNLPPIAKENFWQILSHCFRKNSISSCGDVSEKKS